MPKPIRAVAATLAVALLASPLASPLCAQLSPELRERVEWLKREVDLAPTTPENYEERLEVLWQWGNAVSLDGGFIPINLPLLVRLLRAPDPGGEPTPTLWTEVDDYVRQLERRERPGSIGELRIEAPPASPAFSWQTIRVIYTVGDLGVAEGGGIMVTRHFMATYGDFQWSDPAADNYLTVAASRSGARLVPDEAPMWGPHGGFRGGAAVPVFRLEGTDLEPGDTITVTYGERSGGSRGFQVPDYSNDAISLPIYVDLGDGIWTEFPVPSFRVVGAEVHGVHGFAPSVVGVGEPVTVSVRSEDYWYNRASGAIPEYEVRLDGEPWGTIPAGEATLENDYAPAIHPIEVRFDEPGVYRFTFHSRDGRVSGRANPILVERDPVERVFWGETHGHCGFAEGMGTPTFYFDFARDDARLDFVTLSEHDIWMDAGEWRTLEEHAERYTREGEFLVYPGYEWTQNRPRGGHHNVFFRRPGARRAPAQEAHTLSELYRLLHERNRPQDVLVIPHAHQAGDWRQSDWTLERLVEIMSEHGTFEWFGQAYLENGFQVGFVAASDDHQAHPGYSPGKRYGTADRRPNLHQFGGLAGVWATEKTTDTVFDALRARSTYATTGAQRIVLRATLNNQPMGTDQPFTPERVLEGRVIGTGPIDGVAVIKNGDVVEEWRFGDGAARDGRSRVQVHFESESAPFLRDNPRGQRLWRGRLRVEGARVVAASLAGEVNRHFDEVRLDDGVVHFDVATRGRRRSVELDLEGIADDARVVVEIEPAREYGSAPPLVRPYAELPGGSFTFELGGLEGLSEAQGLVVGRYLDQVSVQLLGDELQDDVRFRFEDNEPGPQDWYYLRVRQVDGTLAWSSPWWVGAEPPL